ncbi:MAG TPA: serine/threonine protein phosphatase [Lachnospiraceae bacterium]|nr:serine/threonine protein phosphatase [Lachnospiraceae bacterium]
MEIKTYEIQTSKLKKGEKPLRLAMLSDLHDRLWGQGQRKLLDAIDSLVPDLILCAGDMLTGGEQAAMDHTLLLFRELSKRRPPVITCNGNHESRMRYQTGIYKDQYTYYTGKLKEYGVKVLVNESCAVKVRSAGVQVYGYEMPLAYYHKFRTPGYDGEDLYRQFGVPDGETYNILLAHNPVYFKAYAAWGADLTLSGHLHGGIIRIPGIGGLITPQARLFPRYDRGLFERNGKYLAVSPGLGEHTVPVRILNPPQLFCIIIKGTG